jgi:hypothetical protein
MFRTIVQGLMVNAVDARTSSQVRASTCKQHDDKQRGDNQTTLLSTLAAWPPGDAAVRVSTRAI